MHLVFLIKYHTIQIREMKFISANELRKLESRKKKLHAAIENGDVEEIKALISDPNTDVEELDERFDRPLVLAADLKNVEIVRLLLDAGAHPELGSWTSPLGAACISGSLEIVELLIDAGVDVNMQLEAGTTAMISAARHGHLEIVKTLFNAGADVNIIDRDMEFALGGAMNNGHTEVVNFLVSKTSTELQAIANQDIRNHSHL